MLVDYPTVSTKGSMELKVKRTIDEYLNITKKSSDRTFDIDTYDKLDEFDFSIVNLLSLVDIYHHLQLMGYTFYN